MEFSGNSVQLTLLSECSLRQAYTVYHYAAKCIWCTKTVDLSNMGRQALVIHMSSSSLCGMTLDI